MIKNFQSGRADSTGAYLKSPSDQGAGAVYIVAGCSGQITGGALNHPAMFTSLNQLGSVVIDVDGSRLDARFLRETGEIDDYFSIIKGPNWEPPRLVTIRVNSGMMEAWFKSVPGETYRIEKTAGLENPQWMNASQDIVAEGPMTYWSGPTPEEVDRSFFRVQRRD